MFHFCYLLQFYNFDHGQIVYFMEGHLIFISYKVHREAPEALSVNCPKELELDLLSLVACLVSLPMLVHNQYFLFSLSN